MRKFKRILAAGLIVVTMMSTTGCGFIKPYDVPELVTIEASQTAFLIPLVGNTNDQASFESEELLRDAKVATKEIQIPHRWVQNGTPAKMVVQILPTKQFMQSPRNPLVSP